MKRPLALRLLLMPFSPLYRMGLWIHDQMLAWGVEPVRNLKAPVVSIGNISTGGSGKTPTTIALAEKLMLRGMVIDVLSRGYGRSSVQTLRVRPDGTATEFGDEPLLIARRSGVPVYVSPLRFQAGLMAENDFALEEEARRIETRRSEEEYLHLIDGIDKAYEEALAEYDKAAHESAKHSVAKDAAKGDDAHEKVDAKHEASSLAPGRPPYPPPPPEFKPRHLIHILDDGFQHRKLARNVDIVLLNREDWRDKLLPVGDLREGREAIHRATVLAIPSEDPTFETVLRKSGWQGPIWKLRRTMVPPQVQGNVAAFCGIAKPEPFFAGIAAADLKLVGCYSFPDHYNFTEEILANLITDAIKNGARTMLTTEKDLTRLGKMVELFPANLPVLPVGLKIELEDEGANLDWLLDRLEIQRPDKRL